MARNAELLAVSTNDGEIHLHEKRGPGITCGAAGEEADAAALECQLLHQLHDQAVAGGSPGWPQMGEQP